MTARVCHLITGLDPGGAEITLYRLLRGGNPARVSPSVVSLLPGGALAPAIRALGVPVVDLGLTRGRLDPRGVWRLHRHLRAIQPDLLQTWMYHADLLGAIAGAWLSSIPVVWNLRASDMDFSRYPPLSAWTVRACARLSHVPRAIVANSEAGVAHHTRLGYRARSWAVIPNGVDAEEFRPDPAAGAAVREELGLPADAVVIGMAARLDPMKDHATLMVAVRTLVEHDPRVHVVLAGAGVTEATLGLTRGGTADGLRHRVRVLGRRADVARLMQAWDLAVSSSLSEGFSNVIVEAMATGVPCVVTDVGESARMVGDTGVVVPPRDPERLAAACRLLIEEGAAARRRRGAAARARVQGEFALDQMITAYAALHETILRPASSG